jgi:hypothetical protein
MCMRAFPKKSNISNWQKMLKLPRSTKEMKYRPIKKGRKAQCIAFHRFKPEKKKNEQLPWLKEATSYKIYTHFKLYKVSANYQ